MGTWGTAIYSNDTAQDVKDLCQEIYPFASPEEGLEIIKKEFFEYFEEPDNPDEDYASFWYAFADWHWKHGMLKEEYRQKAIVLLENKTGIDEWEADARPSDVKKRLAVMQNLLDKLKTEMPPLKRPKSSLWRPRHKPGDVVIFKALPIEEKRVLMDTILWGTNSVYYPDIFCDERLKGRNNSDSEYHVGESYPYCDAHEKYMAVLCVGSAKDKASRYFPHLYHELGVYVYYDYISDEKPDITDLQSCGFLPYIDEKPKGEGIIWAYEATIMDGGFAKMFCNCVEKKHFPEEMERFYRLFNLKNYKRNNEEDLFRINTICDRYRYVYSWKNYLDYLGIKGDNLLDPNCFNPEILPIEECRKKWERWRLTW